MASPPIGIDLGTTRSAIATLVAERPVAIPNREGRSTTPSVVAFDASGRPLVGRAAQRQGTANPDRTIAAVKRLLGSEQRVQVGDRGYAPQEIAAFILRQLKSDAEEWLGESVHEAVLTVPAYFNDRQRRAAREAAVLAGLRIPMLLSEPTAAALAYGLEREDVHTVLVWDLGGGTFDVSVLELGGGIFEVLAVSGDGSLGGVDFDEAVAVYLADTYATRWGVEYPRHPGAQARLREAAERVKLELSSAAVARAFVPFVERSPTPRHLDVTLTEECLGQLVAGLVERLIPPARHALADAKLTAAQVDRVILVGNGSKMPIVRRLVARLLGKEPYRSLDADLVTAMGAAIQAGVIQGRIARAVLLDVLPLSLGVETKGGLFARIVPRNATLPASASQIFSTASDGQVEMRIEIVQGERDLSAENVHLGYLELDDLYPAPAGTVKVEVAFDVDVDGIVHVHARDLLGDSDASARFVSSKGLDPEEIARLIKEAEAFAGRDRGERQRIEAGIEADSAIAAGEMALAQLESGPESLRGQELYEALSRIHEALVDASVPQMRERCAELRRLLGASDQCGQGTSHPIRAAPGAVTRPGPALCSGQHLRRSAR